jgi:hypothetical protein
MPDAMSRVSITGNAFPCRSSTLAVVDLKRLRDVDPPAFLEDGDHRRNEDFGNGEENVPILSSHPRIALVDDLSASQDHDSNGEGIVTEALTGWSARTGSRNA